MVTLVGSDVCRDFGELEGSGPLSFSYRILDGGVLVAGRADSGASGLLEALVRLRLEALASGASPGPLVVLDPMGDLVDSLSRCLPVEVASRVRLLDFGSRDRVPVLNLLDPGVFKDGEECASALVAVLRNSWSWWGNRVEDLLFKSLQVVHAWNSAPPPWPERMGFLDLCRILWEDGTGSGAADRRLALQCLDEPLRSWYSTFLSSPEGGREYGVDLVRSRMTAYLAHESVRAVLGQRRSLVSLPSADADVLLVNLGLGVVGREPGGLVGAALAGLFSRAVAGSGLLVCPDVARLPGIDWRSMSESCAAGRFGLLLGGAGLEHLEGVGHDWPGSAFVFRVPTSVGGALVPLLEAGGRFPGPSPEELSVQPDGICRVRLSALEEGVPVFGRLAVETPAVLPATHVDLAAASAAFSWSGPRSAALAS